MEKMKNPNAYRWIAYGAIVLVFVAICLCLPQ